MLLNTWLTAAKRQFLSAASQRRLTTMGARRRVRGEELENRALLTALVVNADNQSLFTNASGGLTISNADMAGKDSLAIEGISIGASSGNALTINLSGISLKSIAIDTVFVSNYSTNGIEIDLANVTGVGGRLPTLAIEDVSMGSSLTGRGIDISLSNTDLLALTIDDSVFPGVRIDALAGSDISHGLITQNRIEAKSNVEGVLVNVVSAVADVDKASADDFRVDGNYAISSPNRDFVQINNTNSPTNGLQLVNNQIGTNAQGSSLVFRAEGDTFVQPFRLTNNSTTGELLQTFVLDLTSLGLQFDESVNGKPFTPVGNSGTQTGVTSAVVSPNGRVLTVNFNNFNPGETLQFVIDIDLVGGVPASIFGDDLIGAAVSATFTGNRTVAGEMVGDPDAVTASLFAIGPGVAGNTQGVNLNLNNSPITNLLVTGNSIGGAPGHGFLIDANAGSDITGLISDNSILSSGRDGLRLDMADSNFTGAVLANNLSNNGGNGFSVLPSVTRSGLVQQALEQSAGVLITSANHGLQTNDTIIIQGMVNHFSNRQHPANGIHTITRVNNNQFRINGVSGLAPDVLYEGGGAWYKPDFVGGQPQTVASAQGFVSIDLQTSFGKGTIVNAQSVVPGGPIVITSPGHGLTSGQRVRISQVRGNTNANGLQKITVIDANTFSLDGTVDNGIYDTTTAGPGIWTSNPVTGATNTPQIQITAPGHGLQSGDQVRITGVQGNTAANGTFTVSVINGDTFQLNGQAGNGTYAGGGNWTRLTENAGGKNIPQRVADNTITNNRMSGIFVDLTPGTRLLGDIVSNVISENGDGGVRVESHSFGLGTGLHLISPNDQFAIPQQQDLGFDVNIGTGASGDGNTLERNTSAGIVIEALDYGTGSFQIRDNLIASTRDDNNAATPYSGDGIVVRLNSDVVAADAVSLLSTSIIDGNTIGVDNLGNAGHGLLFTMNDRTKIQDLELTNNTFLNNALDGFHFERREDARLNSVTIEKNRATNNGSDGISLYATNTAKDQSGQPIVLDFNIGDNNLDFNGAYGLRLELLTDAVASVNFENNSVVGNGAAANPAGFHPDDNAGNTGKAGGVGILAFQQVAANFVAVGNKIDDNEGDGFSVDAFNFFDTLRLNTVFTNNTFNGNSLTGYRNNGAAFGVSTWDMNQFNGNGEDGVRIVSLIDKNDYFERRVGGMDIAIDAVRNTFNDNTQSGVQLGQGVSAVFGRNTADVSNPDSYANYFSGNGEDGLKITQSAGPYLTGQNVLLASQGFTYARRRHIEASFNYFQNNTGDGIDIGHFAQTEGGNVEHGDEVVTDVHVSISNSQITGNGGDGVEYLADNTLRVSPIVGGGQDVEYLNISSLSISDSRIANNAQRGIDILNRHGEDSYITIINNNIFSNGYEGIYVMNTASQLQLQSGPTDPLLAHLERYSIRSDDNQRVYSVGTKQREIEFEISPNIELRVQDNNIQSNGSEGVSSVVPVNQSVIGAPDETGNPSPAWTHNFTNVPGTLGGLVIRVGAVDSAGRVTNSGALSYTSNPDWELGLSGIDAEVFRNFFSGNVGADVYLDSFTSQIPEQTLGNFNSGEQPAPLLWHQSGYRDPLARLDLVFRENRGDSLDLTNGFAFVDNSESEFKSRERVDSQAPNHSHNNNPDGFWSDGAPFRFRNQQRTMGFFNNVGDDPNFVPYYWTAIDDGGVTVGNWSFDGWGTSTWRVESDFETANFPQVNPTLGYSDFFSRTAISIQGDDTQWDTGRNVPGFVGATNWSLQRGDVFNVGAGLDPILGDQLEENDSFVGAFNLGRIGGAGNSVNARTTNGVLTLHTKADRDYYKFQADDTGVVNINLGATDATGDDLIYMIYEVDATRNQREDALLKAANGSPSFVIVPAGGSQVLTASVVKDRTYVIEVFSTERDNTFNNFIEASGTDGKSFFYGTARTYTLSIDAPGVNQPVGGGFTGSGSGGSGASGSGAGGSWSGGSSGSGGSWNGSLPGPPTASFVAVTPDPRSTAVGLVTLNFNEDVTGVDITDFRLTRNGTSIPLTASLLTAVSPSSYTLNLAALTGESGTYSVSLIATGSGIRDSDNAALTTNAVDSWLVSNAATTFGDTPDAIIGDGAGVDVNGAASLRAMIMEANASVGDDVIVLSAGTYTLTVGTRFEDESAEGDFDIRGNLTIRGVSARDTIIDAALLDRVFHVFPGATLTLENLTLRNGEAFDGGAIFVEGAITVNGVVTPAGALNLRNVNVTNNEAYNQGGAIYNLGTVSAWGSSLVQNLAGSRGGAMHNRGTASFVNTTISTNVATSRGGGVFNDGAASSSMINVTVANNYAGSRAGGLGTETSATAQLGNTILDGNMTDPTTAALGSKFVDLLGPVSSLGNNLIRVLDASSATGTAAGLITSDRFGRTATPLLAGLNPLTTTGGNGTAHHPLQLNGNSVDVGNNALFPVTPVLQQQDQIGNPRIIVAKPTSPVNIDLGAVEYYLDKPVARAVATPNPAGINQLVTFSGANSTHSNPGAKTITKWEWDFDYTATNKLNGTFDVQKSGVTTTWSFPTNGMKNVALRVTDNTNVSEIIEIQVSVSLPDAPVITRPFTVTTDLTPTIQWQSGVGLYDLVIDNLTTGVNGVIVRSNLTANSFTPSSNLPVGRYRVVVTAKNNSGATASTPYIFDVTSVQVTAPTNNTFDTTPLFTWNSVPGTSRYDVWVNRLLPTAAGSVVRNQFISGTSYEAPTALGEGTYAFWVRAFDADGNPGDWSAVSRFNIVKPDVLTPSAQTLDTTPTISWTNVGAPRYELWVDQVGGTSKIIYQPALTSTSFTPTTPLPNGTYRVWVRGVANDGESGLWSLVKTFQMDYRVGPTTISPTGITTDNTPTFTWQAIDGVATYDLWVDNLTTGQAQVIRVRNVAHVNGATNISWTSPGILTPGNYRWWVQATATTGAKSAWSAPANFTVPVPAITSPVSGSTITLTNTPTFQWSGVAQYVSYQLWVDNLTTGVTRVINVTGITGTTYTPPLPLENGTFRAWVRGFDAQGNASSWSTPSDFTLNAGVKNAPTLIGPSGVTSNNRPTFTWQAAADAARYEIVVTQLTANGQPTIINVANITTLSYTSTVTLIPGQTYRWWVRGISSNGTPGAWSQPLDFRVTAVDGLPLLNPADPAAADLVIPVVATFNAQYEFADDVVSISAHPAGTIVQLNADRLADGAVRSDVPEPVASTDAELQIDEVMQLWAEDRLDVAAEPVELNEQNSAAAAQPVPAATAAEVTVEARKPESRVTAMLAGLFTASLVRPGRRGRKE